MKRKWLVCYIVLSPVFILAQQPSFLTSLPEEQVMHITLQVHAKQLYKHKKDKTYVPARLMCAALSDSMNRYEAKVRVRGRMRLDICDQPPLKVKFSKTDLAHCGLAEHNELDIVQPCKEQNGYDQYVLREFLAYKLWEEISPFHFRTRLVKLSIQDPENQNAVKPDSDYAFLVEHEEELIDRLGAQSYPLDIVSRNSVDSMSVLRVALFQFMIGNTDWFISNRHNLTFIGSPEKRLLEVIPYDFDYAGLVDAPYAAHHKSIDLSSVTMRYYQGWCHDEVMVQAVIDEFLRKKERILEWPHKISGFDHRSVEWTTRYLTEFFDILGHPKKMQTHILRHCGMWPVQ